MLIVRVRFSGLSANASAAHIHGPAGTEDAAEVMAPLTNVPNDTSGVIEGRIDLSGLTEEQIAAFKEGRTYLNIHTSANPDGEIRGQVLPLQP